MPWWKVVAIVLLTVTAVFVVGCVGAYYLFRGEASA